MNRNECLKIMYLSPVAVDDHDQLFGEIFKDTKEPSTEVHVTSLNANRGQFSHVEFRSFEAIATPGIISATICAEKEGFDALVIGCFYDTALHDAREVSGNMVVVAPCHSSIEIALGLANNFGIIVGRRKVVDQMKKNVISLGYGEKLAGFYDINFGVNDFQKDHQITLSRLSEVAGRAVEEDYAESIILGCTAETGFYKFLQQQIGVPVVDPAIAALKNAEYRANLKRRLNLIPSRKWSCEPPSDEEVEKFHMFNEDEPFGNRIIIPAT